MRALVPGIYLKYCAGADLISRARKHSYVLRCGGYECLTLRVTAQRVYISNYYICMHARSKRQGEEIIINGVPHVIFSYIAHPYRAVRV